MNIRDKYKQVPKDSITVYCDGSGNNKTNSSGGIGIILLYKGHEKQVSMGSYYNTTTARMEIKAVVESLKLIKNKSLLVTLYSDNIYCVNGYMQGWYLKWIKEEWKMLKTHKDGTSEITDRPNKDLWIELADEVNKFPKEHVTFIHVKGHSGVLYNELCDQLAKDGGKREDLIVDMPLQHLGEDNFDLPYNIYLKVYLYHSIKQYKKSVI